MAYQVSDIKLYKEESFNVAPATPKVLLMKNTSFELKSEQKSEVVELLGNGHEPNKKTYGSYDYSGSLGFVLGGDYFPILLEGAVGAATTVDNATTEAYADSTAYSVGDIVNHSNGTNSLVCYKAGTSSTEPDVTGKKDGDIIVDGTVTWILRPLLKKRAGSLESCLPSFGIERKDIPNCSAGDDHYELFTGLIMESLEVKKEGGEIKFDMSQNLKGLDSDSSFTNSSYTALGAGKQLAENFYNEDDLTIEYFDGTDWQELTGLDSITLTVARNNEIVNTIEGKRPKFKKTTISGTAKGLMSQELFMKSFEKQEKSIRFVYSKVNGDKSIVSFSAVEFGNSSKSITVGEDIMLDIELNASGNADISSTTYECITSVEL